MALRIDDDVLIDAGTGVGRLSLDEIARIDHVFLTHAHMDHMALLPVLIDCRIRQRSEPLTLHGIPETIEALRTHVFNWTIWPDATQIPTPDAPALRYADASVGERVVLGGRGVTMMPAAHSIPAVGYRIDSAQGTVMFSGDTARCPPFWDVVAQTSNLRALIVELSYRNGREKLAHDAGHLCASTLAPMLAALKTPVDLYIVHCKPLDAAQIEQEVAAVAGIHRLHMLREGDSLEW